MLPLLFEFPHLSLLPQEPYNVERILWLLSGSDSCLIKTLMEQFNISKRLKLPEDLHRKVSSSPTQHCAYVCIRRLLLPAISNSFSEQKNHRENMQPKI